MLTVSSSGLTKIVAARRVKEIVSTVGCIVGDVHHLPTSRPGVRNAQIVKPAQDPEPRFPEVWRDRFSATVQIASAPQYRSLTSL